MYKRQEKSRKWTLQFLSPTPTHTYTLSYTIFHSSHDIALLNQDKERTRWLHHDKQRTSKTSREHVGYTCEGNINSLPPRYRHADGDGNTKFFLTHPSSTYFPSRENIPLPYHMLATPTTTIQTHQSQLIPLHDVTYIKHGLPIITLHQSCGTPPLSHGTPTMAT